LHESRHDNDEFRRWTRRKPLHDGDAADGARPTRRSPKLARLEAALIVADGALSARKLAHVAALLDVAEARQLIDELNAAYDAVGSAFRVERAGAGYQLFTRPVFARWLDRVHERQARLKLSPPALETLTIVAYRQPLTRADIEALRGVQSAEILKHLMERGLIRIVGEDNSLGRPYLYGTTRQFLEHYGLRSLDELPNADQLRRQTAARAVLRVAAADTEAGAAAEDAADRSRAA
jgi:segregation and condensation protein B